MNRGYFNRTYDMLANKPGNKYEFIMKCGVAMKLVLFKLCQVVWKTERQPDRWCKSILIKLYRSKGSQSVIDNMRHIHMKDQFPKFFGHLVVSESKDKMISNMTNYQDIMHRHNCLFLRV